MSNMSYCRFENVLGDLMEAEEHLLDDLSDSEHQRRRDLIFLCRKIVEEADDNPSLEKEKDNDS